MRKDIEGVNNGSVDIIIENTEIVVGMRFCMRIIYTVGSNSILDGGCLRFKLPGFYYSNMSKAPVFCSNPEVIFECTTHIPSINGKNGIEFSSNDYLFITIKNSALKQNDTITVDYGFNNISKFEIAPLFAQKWRVEVATDLDGTRNAPGSGFQLVKNLPLLHFINDKAVKIEITIPSYTKAGEPFEMFIRVRDKYNNIVEDYNGKIKLFMNVIDNTQYIGECTFSKEEKGICVNNNLSFINYGVNRIIAIDEGLSLYGRSNPSRTTEADPTYNIFWGETHTHSVISADEAAGNSLFQRPEGVYAYARDKSDLDFCMVTDHSENITKEEWIELKKASERYYEPGKFVTFNAYESTHSPFRDDGDKNIYFLTDDIDFINQGSTKEVYNELKKYKNKVISIPHQHHLGTNWALNDSEVERVVEIYSHWGCGLTVDSEFPMIPGARRATKPENYVDHALEQGVKLGFIASGDHSYGHPGDDFWWKLSSYNGGLAAVYGKALTRQDIWNSLWNRCCYATTRARIIIQFEINGHMMGEEFYEISDERIYRKIVFGINGTTLIKKVELIKNHSIIYTKLCDTDLDFESSIVDTKAERKTDYYYLHVVQADGEQAWSSPIWITGNN